MNFTTFQDRIVEAFRVIEEDLLAQKTKVLEKAVQLKELKDRLFVNKIAQYTTQLISSKILGQVVEKTLEIGEDFYLLSLRDFLVESFIKVVFGREASSMSVKSLPSVFIDEEIAVSLQFEMDELEHPFVRLKAQLEQTKSDYSKLKAKASRKSNHTIKVLEGNLQCLKRFKSDLEGVKKDYEIGLLEIHQWMRNELENMVQSGILVDSHEVQLKRQNDLVLWAELRSLQANYAQQIQATKQTMEEMKTNAQEINRDITHRKCVPSQKIVQTVGDAVKELRENLKEMKDGVTLLPKDLSALREKLMATLNSEEEKVTELTKEIGEIEGEFQKMTRMWHHLTHAYEQIVKRATPLNKEGYLEDIKHVVPNSDKRLKAFSAASLKREQEKSKQSEVGAEELRVGIKMLRNTGGFESIEQKIESIRTTQTKRKDRLSQDSEN